jgi:hypothetical protein
MSRSMRKPIRSRWPWQSSSRPGARALAISIDYRALDSILEALIGNVEHRVAVIGFDSAPHLLTPFTDEYGRRFPAAMPT